MAEARPPAIRENQCDTLSGSMGVPTALGIKSCSRQAGPIAIRSSARRARWRRSSSTSSGVKKRVRRERAVLSSPITRRVLRLVVSARSRTRFTACVTFSVAASQSNADQCRPSASPRRSPNASITVSNGSSRGHLFKKSPCLVNGERSPFVSPNARCGGESGCVPRNQALSLSLPQSAAKYSSNDADRVGAVAGVALPDKKLINIRNRQLAQNLSAQRWLEVQTHRVRVAV